MKDGGGEFKTKASIRRKWEEGHYHNFIQSRKISCVYIEDDYVPDLCFSYVGLSCLLSISFFVPISLYFSFRRLLFYPLSSHFYSFKPIILLFSTSFCSLIDRENFRMKYIFCFSHKVVKFA